MKPNKRKSIGDICNYSASYVIPKCFYRGSSAASFRFPTKAFGNDLDGYDIIFNLPPQVFLNIVWERLGRSLFPSRLRMVLVMAGAFLLFLSHPTNAMEFCPFQGQFNFANHTLELQLGKKDDSVISIRLAKIADQSYKLRLDLENLKTSGFEISTQLESSFEVVESIDKKKHFLQGQVISRYSLINHKPIEELTGNFQVKDHTLIVSSGSMGGVNINGFLELLNPYKMSFSVRLDAMPMSDFLSIWADNPDLRAQGQVSGTIQILGILNHLMLKGSLSSYNGAVEELSYNSIALNAEGEYPMVRLFDTTITQLDGIIFHVEGDLDLSNRHDFRKQISALSKSPLVKEGNSQWEWTIKRREEEDLSGAELKYFLKKKSSEENPLKEESAVMGVEQKIKF